MRKRHTILALTGTLTTATAFTIAVGLAPGAQAAVRIQAPPAAAVTSGDTTPPSVPTGLGYRITCSLDFTLQWNASTDNVGVAAYDIYRAVSGGAFAPVGTSTTTSFADHLGGVWRYEVRARDAAGNVSAFTAPISVVPPPCPSPPPPSSAPPSSAPPSSAPSGTGCAASFSVLGSWTGGFQGQVTVTNPGTTPTTSWTVTLTFSGGQAVTQLWSGRTSSTRSPYTVLNESYNGALAPGASTMFGFLASSPGTGASATTACTRMP